MALDKATMMAAEAQEGPHDESMEFDLPESVELEAGEEKDVLCKIRSLGNGRACLVDVEGNPVGPPPSTEEYEEEEPDINERFSKFQKDANLQGDDQ